MKRILLAVALVLVLFTLVGSGTAQAGAPVYYVVQYGDTMSGIAARYGMSTWSLAYANGVWNPSALYAGQVLVVPTGGYGYGYGYGYPSYNRYYSPYYSSYYNPTPYYNPYYNPSPVVYYPRPTYGCYYWVRYGDTLSGIAAYYGGNPWTIARANGLYNLNWVYAGQRLFIPGCN